MTIKVGLFQQMLLMMKADAELMSVQGRVGVQESLLPLQEEGPARRLELGRPQEEVRQEQTGKCIQQKASESLSR